MPAVRPARTMAPSNANGPVLAVTLLFAVGLGERVVAAESTAAPATEEAAINLRLMMRGLDPTATDRWTQAAREQVAGEVAQQKQVDAFLTQRRLMPKDDELDEAVAAMSERLRVQAAARGEQPQGLPALLQQAATNEAALRNYLRSERAMARFLSETVTEEVIAAEFERNRAWYDGTAVDVVQTVAATREQLGDVPDAPVMTVIGLRAVPRPIAEAALEAEPGSTLEPIETRHGWHRVRVVAKRQGDGTLEDARRAVLQTLERRARADILSQSR